MTGDSEMTRAWRADRRLDSTAADVLPKLEGILDSLGPADRDLRETVNETITGLWELRARIARRWD